MASSDGEGLARVWMKKVAVYVLSCVRHSEGLLAELLEPDGSYHTHCLWVDREILQGTLDVVSHAEMHFHWRRGISVSMKQRRSSYGQVTLRGRCHVSSVAFSRRFLHGVVCTWGCIVSTLGASRPVLARRLFSNTVGYMGQVLYHYKMTLVLTG